MVPFFFFFCGSSMTGAAGSLGSMTGTCIQQPRDHHSHHHHHHHHPPAYPYMFTDPLHSLSPVNYAAAARVNQSMAHSQPPTTAHHHPAAYAPSAVSVAVTPTATGTG